MTDIILLKQAMANLEEETVLRIINEVTQCGGEKAGPALEACQEGMEEVGSRFEAGEYYLSDLVFAGEIMTEVIEIIRPYFCAGLAAQRGKLILCTVKGDIHDIGKDIVKNMLEAAGFEVVDLGVDVPAEKILETAKYEDIRIVALSGVLTLALHSMKDVVDSFRQADLRDKVKIIIGGNPVTEEACRAIGADAWTHSPQKGVEICSAWAGEN